MNMFPAVNGLSYNDKKRTFAHESIAIFFQTQKLKISLEMFYIFFKTLVVGTR